MTKICLLLFPALLFAGSVSQWSSWFVLKDSGLGNKTENLPLMRSASLNLSAQPNPLNSKAAIRISGIQPDRITGLKIFGLDGQLKADLTTLVRQGTESIVWNASQISAGIYLARLSCGQTTKNLRLVVLK